MEEQTYKWEDIYAHPEFESLVRKRRAVILGLFVVAMLFFFSVPLIVVFWPELFRIRLTGAINVGLAYLIAQYLVGTVIALRYVSLLRTLDGMVDRLSGSRPAGLVAALAH